MIDMLAQAGRCNFSPMSGAVALSWQDISAWSDMTCTVLSPSEALTIRELSQAFAAETNRSSNEETIAPYTRVEYDRAEVADKVKSVFSSFGKKAQR